MGLDGEGDFEAASEAAGEVLGLVVFVLGEADAGDELVSVELGEIADFGGEFEVLEDGEGGEYGLIEGAVGAVGLVALESGFDFAFGGAFEAGEKFEEG